MVLVGPASPSLCWGVGLRPCSPLFFFFPKREVRELTVDTWRQGGLPRIHGLRRRRGNLYISQRGGRVPNIEGGRG